MRNFSRIQKISFVQKELLQWFKTNRRSFPWRSNSMNNYRYIIAEILLQRTRAESVAKFYPQFVIQFKNWKSIDAVSQRELANSLIPVGLYRQRAGRLKNLAHEMVMRGGRIPKERKVLETIPFFGQYITNAILLFVQNKPAPLLDVNMSRVVERLFGKRKMADIRYDPYLQKLAQDVVTHPLAKELNWAILDYAAMICKPKPQCAKCRLTVQCKFFKSKEKRGAVILDTPKAQKSSLQ
jgi:A/G-specific adenine glycosylase